MEWDDDEFTREPLDAAKLLSHDDRDSDDSSPVEEPLPDDCPTTSSSGSSSMPRGPLAIEQSGPPGGCC